MATNWRELFEKWDEVPEELKRKIFDAFLKKTPDQLKFLFLREPYAKLIWMKIPEEKRLPPKPKFSKGQMVMHKGILFKIMEVSKEPPFKYALQSPDRVFYRSYVPEEELTLPEVAKPLPPVEKRVPVRVTIGKSKPGEYMVEWSLKEWKLEEVSERPLMVSMNLPMKEIEKTVVAHEEFYDASEIQRFKGEDWYEELPSEFKEDATLVWTDEQVEWSEDAIKDREIFHYEYKREDLDALTVEDLRHIAAIKNLSTRGTKEELIATILRIEKPPEVPPLPVAVPPARYYYVDSRQASFEEFLVRWKEIFGEAPIPPTSLYVPKPPYKYDLRITAEPTLPPVAPPSKAPPPKAPPVKVPGVPKGLTADQIRLLRAKFNVALIDELGRVPPNASSVFLVKLDEVKDKPYEEALKHVLDATKEVVSREAARVRPPRPPRERRVEPYRPPREREEEFYVVARVPPSYPPTEALNGPEERPFPRHPTSRENERLWKAFQYRLQELGMVAFDYQREWDEYIYGSNHRSWKELLKRYELFTECIIQGKTLPPLEIWKGVPIPYGLEGLLSDDPDQKVADLIIWAASTTISNARFLRRLPDVDEVISKLEEMGILVTYEDVRDALMKGYTKLKGTNMKYDVWFTNISLEDLEELIATRGIRKPEEGEGEEGLPSIP